MKKSQAVVMDRPGGTGRRSVLSAAEAPDVVRRLLKGYDVSTLSWANPDHRYAIVRAILVRGEDQAAHWLGSILRRNEVNERSPVRGYFWTTDEVPRTGQASGFRMLGDSKLPSVVDHIDQSLAWKVAAQP